MSEDSVSGHSVSSPLQLEVTDLRVEIAGHQGVVRPIDGVSLEIAPGEAVGLVGESGSGKSMTLKSILGLLPPDAKVTSGSVVFDGTDLTRLSQSRLNKVRGRRIAMIFQEPMSALNPVMRVGNQIAEGPRVHLGMSRAQSVERAIDLMRRVGIPEPERRFRAYPHEFSGGMRQRVMIAMALSCDPELILCDEPTTALDVTIQDQILRLLIRLCRESGTSLMFVTHDLPVVAQVCHKVAVMYAGRIVERGTVSEVFTQPLHPYTLDLLRSAPDVDDPGQSLVPIPGSPPSLVSPPSGCRFHPRCQFAEDDCKVTDPRLRLLEGDRATACLHYERCLDQIGTHP
jgi:oligopeptide/dipeptide ABC transporter ATP-binding protein